MTDREKLIELLNDMQTEGNKSYYVEWAGCKMKHEVKNEQIADHLIANGVTFATDTNVGDKWIPVTERLPEGFTSCIVYRKGIYGGHFSMLRYSQELGWHFYDSEWGDVTVDDVTHWMPLPEPPKGE